MLQPSTSVERHGFDESMIRTKTVVFILPDSLLLDTSLLDTEIQLSDMHLLLSNLVYF